MPQIKTVSVTYERKQNLGDYSSATIGCQIWADVEPTEDLDAVMRGLWAMAKTNTKANLLPLVQKFQTTVERGSELYLGLAPQTDVIGEPAPAEADHAA